MTEFKSKAEYDKWKAQRLTDLEEKKFNPSGSSSPDKPATWHKYLLAVLVTVTIIVGITSPPLSIGLLCLWAIIIPLVYIDIRRIHKIAIVLTLSILVLMGYLYAHDYFYGPAATLVVVFFAYVLPLSPTVILFISKRIKSKRLMNASLIIGVLPAFAMIIMIMIRASNKHDSWDVSPYILLLVCIPWLVIRTPSYLLCKVKDNSFKRQNNILNVMFLIDAVLLLFAVMMLLV